MAEKVAKPVSEEEDGSHDEDIELVVLDADDNTEPDECAVLGVDDVLEGDGEEFEGFECDDDDDGMAENALPMTSSDIQGMVNEALETKLEGFQIQMQKMLDVMQRSSGRSKGVEEIQERQDKESKDDEGASNEDGKSVKKSKKETHKSEKLSSKSSREKGESKHDRDSQRGEKRRKKETAKVETAEEKKWKEFLGMVSSILSLPSESGEKSSEDNAGKDETKKRGSLPAVSIVKDRWQKANEERFGGYFALTNDQTIHYAWPEKDVDLCGKVPQTHSIAPHIKRLYGYPARQKVALPEKLSRLNQDIRQIEWFLRHQQKVISHCTHFFNALCVVVKGGKESGKVVEEDSKEKKPVGMEDPGEKDTGNKISDEKSSEKDDSDEKGKEKMDEGEKDPGDMDKDPGEMETKNHGEKDTVEEDVGEKDSGEADSVEQDSKNKESKAKICGGDNVINDILENLGKCLSDICDMSVKSCMVSTKGMRRIHLDALQLNNISARNELLQLPFTDQLFPDNLKGLLNKYGIDLYAPRNTDNRSDRRQGDRQSRPPARGSNARRDGRQGSDGGRRNSDRGDRRPMDRRDNSRNDGFGGLGEKRTMSQGNTNPKRRRDGPGLLGSGRDLPLNTQYPGMGITGLGSGVNYPRMGQDAMGLSGRSIYGNFGSRLRETSPLSYNTSSGLGGGGLSPTSFASPYVGSMSIPSRSYGGFGNESD